MTSPNRSYLTSTALFLIASALALHASPAEGEPLLLGPRPYLSAADSPFPVDGSHPNFFLEDFEDGLLNTPGVSLQFIPNRTFIQGPGPETDSVDGDDGTIDGSGAGGWALQQKMLAEEFEIYDTLVRFEFSNSGIDPSFNAFGIVWTDSPRSNLLQISAYDEFNQVVLEHTIRGLGDDLKTGETAEDRFVGFILDEAFSAVEIYARSASSRIPPTPTFPVLELDHLQYGVIPEPSAFALVAFTFALSAFGRPERLTLAV